MLALNLQRFKECVQISGRRQMNLVKTPTCMVYSDPPNFINSHVLRVRQRGHTLQSTTCNQVHTQQSTLVYELRRSRFSLAAGGGTRHVVAMVVLGVAGAQPAEIETRDLEIIFQDAANLLRACIARRDGRPSGVRQRLLEHNVMVVYTPACTTVVWMFGRRYARADAGLYC